MSSARSCSARSSPTRPTAITSDALTAAGPLGFTEREWRLVIPLSFAAFFENYDYALLSIAAPVLSNGLGATSSEFGLAVSVIRLAGLAAVVLVGLADRIGRRHMLLVTLGGLAVFTGATAAAWGLVSFVILGALSRIFLSAEGVMAGVVISEEVHPTRRGRAISLSGLVGQTAFGAVAVLIAIVPHLPLGWRWLYLLALGPLGLVATLRRNLPETHAFDAARREDRLQRTGRPRLDRRWWPRTGACMVVFGVVGAVQTAGVYHAAQLAQDTYAWEGRYTVVILTSGLATLAGFIIGGRGSDRVGRRPILTLGMVVEVVGLVVMFVGGSGWYPLGWNGFALGQAMIAGCWVAFVAELVPTEVRATVSSVVVACQVAAGSFGLAVSSALGDTPRAAGRITSVIGVAGLLTLVVLWRLPEVGGRDVVDAYDDVETSPG